MSLYSGTETNEIRRVTGEIQEDDYSWTAGNDPGVVHVRLIDCGATGEVHEMRDTRTGKVFARKLLQPFGKLRREDIRNELRAVDKLCKSLNHPNIVAVLNFGTMDRYYFLDMELCDLTLETHLRQKWDEATAAKLPYLSTPPSSRMKMIQILGIMEDVAAGVAFIHLHNEIHRDLKPRNVMYSYRDHSWKIADFGLTKEGSTGRAFTTVYSRGTDGFRAPELLKDSKATYSNKVDIWAMGCIFYELAVQRRPFSVDAVAKEYSAQYTYYGHRLEISIDSDTFPNQEFVALFKKAIQDMLEVDPLKRPRAIEVLQRFKMWKLLAKRRGNLFKTKSETTPSGNHPSTGNDSAIGHVRYISAGGYGEVHEMVNVDTKQHFARKLLHVNRSSRVDVEREISTLERLASLGMQKNIVTVLSHGWLPQSRMLYHIDMELCDLNLNNYIRKEWTPKMRQTVPYFTENLPTRMRVGQIWDIMDDITKGVSFLHQNKMIHRDLTPCNVLYSRKDQVWKVADFGITRQGTSATQTTSYRRGTACYQAPELLLQGVFTNKSDIWAIGCILYHLILERPAFRNEYAVFDYNSDPDKVLDIAIDAQTLPDERRRAFLSKVIQEMLDRGPQMRPRAEELYKKFTGWGVESSDPQPGARSPGPVSGKMAVEQGGTEGGFWLG